MTAAAGTRTKGRAFALQLLYARDHDPTADVAGAATEWATDFDLELDPAAQDFARELVAAATERAAELDQLITASSRNWRLERMSRVDRNILRLAVYEMNELKTPPAVVIDEALELARQFSGEESVAFINGVLDAVRRDVDPPNTP